MRCIKQKRNSRYSGKYPKLEKNEDQLREANQGNFTLHAGVKPFSFYIKE